MKVEGGYIFNGSPENLLKLGMEPQILKKCLPECEVGLIVPDKLSFQAYGYRGVVKLRRVSLGFWSINLILGSGILSNVAKLLSLKLGSSLLHCILRLAVKGLKIFSSVLKYIKAEFSVEGKGSAGTFNGRGLMELELRASSTLVKYKADIWLGGAGALLEMGAASPAVLDFQGIIDSLFENLGALLGKVEKLEKQ